MINVLVLGQMEGPGLYAGFWNMVVTHLSLNQLMGAKKKKH
jgi:hypothetical protein